MSKNRRKIRTLSHCFYECKYHIVWTPKYRGKVFCSDYIKQEVKRLIGIVCKWKGYEVFELNVQSDHIHLCIGIHPRDSIFYAMQVIKGKTSKWLKKKNKKLAGLCYKGSLWARGYFVSTIGADENIVRRYVKHQNHKNQVRQPTLWDQLPPAS